MQEISKQSPGGKRQLKQEEKNEEKITKALVQSPE
jgi:hypothetical protein